MNLNSDSCSLNNSLSSTSSAIPATSSTEEPTSDPLLSTLQTPQQPSFTRRIHLRTKDEVRLTLSQPPGVPKEFLLDKICLDDELIWLLITSKLERLYLRNCTFNSHDPVGFGHILNFLIYRHSSEASFVVAVQFDDFTSQWILYDRLSTLEPADHGHVDSLLFILSGNIPQQPLLDEISFLAIIPQKSDLENRLSSECKKTLKSIMNHHYPNLNCLLLMNICFDDNIDDFIYISQLKPDLIYLWECAFMASDLIWSTLSDSINLVDSMFKEKAPDLQFTIYFNGHITKILMSENSSFMLPNSPDFIHGLVVTLSDAITNNLHLDNIAFLAFISSEESPVVPLFPQSKQILKSIIGRHSPNLKYLLLKNVDFDDDIEDFVPLSQLKLDLIYIYNCSFKTRNPTWLALGNSMNLVNSIHAGKVLNFQFAIPMNGCTTQIVISCDQSFPMPNSPDLGHGLIFSLGENLPSDLSLDNISFLTFFSSAIDVIEHLSPQAEQILRFIMNRQYLNLNCLLLINVDFNGNIEDSVSISQMRPDLIYLWNCDFTTSGPIWSSLRDHMNLIDSVYKEDNQSFRFAILVKKHITRIIIHNDASFLMPNSPDMSYVLISS